MSSNIFDDLYGKQESNAFDEVYGKEEPKQQKEYPHGVASFINKHPKESALGALIANTIQPVELASSFLGARGFETPVSNKLKELSGINELPEEAQEEAEVLNFLAGIAGPALAKTIYGGLKSAGGLAKGFLKGSKTVPKAAIAEAIPAIETPAAKTAAESIQEVVSPKQIPFESRYDTGKAIYDAIPVPKQAAKFIEFSEPQLQGGRSLANRVTRSGADVGIRPNEPVSPSEPSLPSRVGAIMSPRGKFENSTIGGTGTKNEIMAIDRATYENVNEQFDRSRELNRNIINTDPQNLIQNLQNHLAEIVVTPGRVRSGPQQQLVGAMEDMIQTLGVFDAQGNLVATRPIPNQNLIEWQQSLRKKVDHDFAHGNAKNVFRPVINLIQDEVESTAANNPEAFNALQNARFTYRDWVTHFDNDYVRPFRDISNQDFKKLYESSLHTDNLNALVPVLSRSRRGQTFLRGIQRDAVERELSPILKNPGKFSEEEIDKALRELRPIMAPNQERQIRTLIERQCNRSQRNISKTKREVPKHPFEGQSPEQIAKKLDSQSGLDEVEKELSKTTKGKEVLTQAKEQKTTDMLYEGRITPKEDIKSIKEMFNNREDVAMLKRLMGRERFDKLDLIVKEEQSLREALDKLPPDKAAKYEAFRMALNFLVRPKYAAKKVFSKAIDSLEKAEIASLKKEIAKDSKK